MAPYIDFNNKHFHQSNPCPHNFKIPLPTLEHNNFHISSIILVVFFEIVYLENICEEIILWMGQLLLLI